MQRVATLTSPVWPPQPYGHLMIPVTIGDRSSHLVLDTGGAWSILDKDFAQEIGLQARRLTSDFGTYSDASGEQISSYVRAPAATIGGLPVKGEVDFLLAPIGKGRSSDEIGGTLGLNVLGQYDVEIDNARRTVTMYLPSPNVEWCGAHWADEAVALRFRYDNGMPVTRASINDKEVDALIDTGSSVTIIDIDFARRRLGLTPESASVTSDGPQQLPGGKAAQFYRTIVKTISIGGIQFETVPVALSDLDDVDLVLGMNELRHLHLYFAFRRHTIYATQADALHQAMDVQR